MSYVSPPAAPTDQPLDRTLLRVYLNDHLGGSVAGLRRMDRTARALARTPVGPGLRRVAMEVEQEHEELRDIVDRLGLPASVPKQVAAWTGERVARLASNGRLVRHSTMTPLLELELLRSAVVGKRGMWLTLTDLAPALGIDAGRMSALIDQSDRQLETLDAAHAYVRVRALSERRVP
jgi:UDP-glucose 4-epimerase